MKLTGKSANFGKLLKMDPRLVICQSVVYA